MFRGGWRRGSESFGGRVWVDVLGVITRLIFDGVSVVGVNLPVGDAVFGSKELCRRNARDREVSSSIVNLAVLKYGFFLYKHYGGGGGIGCVCC